MIEGVHWPTLDEDISVEGFLAGRRSIKTIPRSSHFLPRVSPDPSSPPLPNFPTPALTRPR